MSIKIPGEDNFFVPNTEITVTVRYDKISNLFLASNKQDSITKVGSTPLEALIALFNCNVDKDQQSLSVNSKTQKKWNKIVESFTKQLISGWTLHFTKLNNTYSAVFTYGFMSQKTGSPETDIPQAILSALDTPQVRTTVEEL